MSVINNSALAGASGASAAAAGGGYEIARSLRFNSGDSPRLSRAFPSNGNTKTWTWSCWIKFCNNTGNQVILHSEQGSNFHSLYLRSDGTLKWDDVIGGSDVQLNKITNQVFRDFSAWYHLVLAVDTTQSTAADRNKMYVNGVQATFASGNDYAQNDISQFNHGGSFTHYLGGSASGTSVNAYLADIQFLDGIAASPSDFAETDSNGVYQPKKYEGNYGVAAGTGPNYSSETVASNGWTSNDPLDNMWDGDTTTQAQSTASNQTTHVTWTPATPITNVTSLRVYCLLNSNQYDARDVSVNGGSYYNPNVYGSAQWWDLIANTQFNSGDTLTEIKWQSRWFSGGHAGNAIYAVEVNGQVLTNPAPAYQNGFHLDLSDNSINTALGYDTSSGSNTTDKGQNFNAVAYAGSGAARTINCGFRPGLVWIKQRSGTQWHYLIDSVRGNDKALFSNVNNAEYTTSTQVLTSFNNDGFSLGTDSAVNASSSTYVAWAWKAGDTATTITAGSLNSSAYNDSSNWTSGASNANMQNNWETSFDGNMSNFALPNTGYASPTLTFSPAISYSTLELLVARDTAAPDLLVNGSALNVPITNSSNYGGAYKVERFTFTNGTLTSIGHQTRNTAIQGGSGFYQIIVDGKILVNSGVTPPNVPSIPSTVSANQDYGMSIVTYSAGSTGALVAHGLGEAPGLIIAKGRNNAVGWITYHSSLGKDKYIYLNLTNAEASSANYWGSAGPDSNVFGLSNSGYDNNVGNMVAYCFAPKAGYSKFGSYSGNNSSTGPTITTGFKPAFLLVKSSTSATSWTILDNARDPSGTTTRRLFPDEDSAELVGSNGNVDFNDNGFQIRTSHAGLNGSGQTYIYAAFAEDVGNHFDVNNLTVSTGDTTPKQNFDAVTYTGNGSTKKIGGTIFSSGLTASAFNSGYEATKAFDGDTTNTRALTPNNGYIAWSGTINDVNTIEFYRFGGNTDTTISVNGETAVNFPNASWTTVSFTGTTVTSFRVEATNNQNAVLSGVRVNGTVLIDGDGSTFSFSPDLLWIKQRNSTMDHALWDSVRGITKELYSNQSYAEGTATNKIQSLDANGFTLKNNSVVNGSGDTYVAWTWNAGANSNKTYTVKVVSDSGNKYRFDDFGTSAVTLELAEGSTYVFDQSDSSNSGHPLRFSTTSNGTHGGGSEYTTGVTVTGTPGSAGAKTTIVVASGAPTLHYYCTQHSGMGGQVNTNSTAGASNFDGSIQAVVKANQAYGFSVVSYTGSSTNGATVGHGLNAPVKVIILKARNDTQNWFVNYPVGTGDGYLMLNSTDAGDGSNSTVWNSTAPTSSVFTLGTSNAVNNDTLNYIAYCWSEVAGFSKFGSYSGTGSNHTINCGFKPAWVMIKCSSTSGEEWMIFDSARNPSNPRDKFLKAESSNAEATYQQRYIHFEDNGFSFPGSTGQEPINLSGRSYIYMAFADNSGGEGCDSLVDSPEQRANQTDSGAGGTVVGNYCTWNPLANSSISNGNLDTAGTGNFYGTIALPSSGKYYWEVTAASTSYIGIDTRGQGGTNYIHYNPNGQKQTASGSSSYGDSFTTGDIIGVAVNMDDEQITWYKNNSSQGTVNFSTASLSKTDLLHPQIYQDSSATSSTNWGQRPFTYTAPSGYECLNTGSLPTPTIRDGSQYFDTELYTGNGGLQAIGGEVYSSTSSVTVNNSNSNQSGSLAGVFNGNQTANSSNAYGFTTGAMDFTWTPATAISYNSKVRVWTGFSGGSIYLNGGSAVSTANNNWTTVVDGSSGSITSIRFTVGSGGGWWTGIEVDDVVLVDGNGSTISFSPDFVWIKQRSGSAQNHALFDSLRGAGHNLSSSTNHAERSDHSGSTGDLRSFDVNGFSLGSSAASGARPVNLNGEAYVAWAWDGGDLVTNSAYNQSQTWSSGGGTGLYSGSNWTGTFDGTPATTGSDIAQSAYVTNSGSSTLTFSSSISGALKATACQGSNSPSTGNDRPTITLSDGTVQRVSAANNNPGEIDFGSVSNISSLTIAGTSAQGMNLIKLTLDGKLLVDPGVIPAGAANSTSYNQSQRWSADVTGDSAFTLPASNAFDGNLTTNCKIFQTNNPIQIVFPTPISDVTLVEVYRSSGDSNINVRYNNQSSSDAINFPDSQWTTVYSGPAISLVNVIVATTNTQPGLAAIRVNGKILVDGGYNQSQTWSDDFTFLGNALGGTSAADAFDGSLTTQAQTQTSGDTYSNHLVFAPTGGLAYTSSVKIYCPNGQMAARINGGAWQTFSTDKVLATGSGTITSIDITEQRSNAGFGVYAYEVDGKLLVDPGAGVTPPNVPSIASTVRANPSAGFSIVTATSSSSSANNFAHGLNAAPELVIVKLRVDAGNGYAQDWQVYHSSIGNTGGLYLNLTQSKDTSSSFWNNTTPTSSVISIGASSRYDGNFVAYCFAPVEGYSAIGSYTGNGAADGPFVFTGHSSRWILIKVSSATNDWVIYDTERDTYNASDAELYPNTSGAENTSGPIDILSNGFKLRNAHNHLNQSGQTYIYLALADNPFQNSRAR